MKALNWKKYVEKLEEPEGFVLFLQWAKENKIFQRRTPHETHITNELFRQKSWIGAIKIMDKLGDYYEVDTLGIFYDAQDLFFKYLYDKYINGKLFLIE